MDLKYANTDALLWKKFLEGDSGAYSQIYRQTAQDLFRLGLLYTSDREVVKDCIQDMFVKIYTNRAALAPTDNIMAYLTVTLKNTIFNALKKQTSDFSLEENIPSEKSDEEIYSSPETLYIDKEQEQTRAATVHTMMSKLTHRQREIIFYRYIREMTIDEISEITQMNNQSVSNSIQRALGSLRSLFRKK